MKKVTLKHLKIISRIFTGLVFVFSAFVKGVDPLGTAYRIEDYFIAYNWNGFIPFALFLSIALSTLEFVLGMALLANIHLKKLAWVLLALMAFFTGITLYDAIYEHVSDCGCFGDAIKLTHWQTFYKNILLMAFVVLIFRFRKTYASPFNIKKGNAIILLSILVFFCFSYYQYLHLPMIDFREWKEGNNMIKNGSDAGETFLIFRNIESGETAEYPASDYPWNDSTWVKQWRFVDQRIADANLHPSHLLHIEDVEGNDWTSAFLENPDFQFMVIAWDITAVTQKAMERINIFYEGIEATGYSLIGLTSSIPEKVNAYIQQTNTEFKFYYADDVVLKTMIRANPGIILLENGVVKGKWNFRDIPEIAELKKRFANF